MRCNGRHIDCPWCDCVAESKKLGVNVEFDAACTGQIFVFTDEPFTEMQKIVFERLLNGGPVSGVR